MLGYTRNFLHGSLNNTLQEDPSWLDNRLVDPESVFLPYHSLKPLLTPDKSSLRWIPQHAVSQLLGTSTVVLLGIAPAKVPLSPPHLQNNLISLKGHKGGKVAHFAIDVTKVQNLLQVCGEGVFEEARAAVVSLATDQVYYTGSMWGYSSSHAYLGWHCGSRKVVARLEFAIEALPQLWGTHKHTGWREVYHVFIRCILYFCLSP